MVMDNNHYISELMRQLNSNYYEEVAKPELEALHQSIQLRVKELYQNKTLDKETYLFLSIRKNDTFRYWSVHP